MSEVGSKPLLESARIHRVSVFTVASDSMKRIIEKIREE